MAVSVHRAGIGPRTAGEEPIVRLIPEAGQETERVLVIGVRMFGLKPRTPLRDRSAHPRSAGSLRHPFWHEGFRNRENRNCFFIHGIVSDQRSRSSISDLFVGRSTLLTMKSIFLFFESPDAGPGFFERSGSFSSATASYVAGAHPIKGDFYRFERRDPREKIRDARRDQSRIGEKGHL